MFHLLIFALTFFCGVLFPLGERVEAKSFSESVREGLQSRITLSTGQGEVVCRLELLCSSDVLPRFYSDRGFQAAWSNEAGPLSQAQSLVNAIRGADRDGLRPRDYHLSTIEAQLNEIKQDLEARKPLEAEKVVDLDLLLTDAFLLYASHLTSGRVNPETIQSEWFIRSREIDLVKVLQLSIDHNQLEGYLDALRPQHVGYGRLGFALSRYREILKRGGWPLLPSGPKMQKGDQNERVRVLRSRLSISGDLGVESKDSETLDFFDGSLDLAVRRFQDRHGLQTDGIVGKATLAALNVPVEDRIRQIELNMERWRWLPSNLGERYILVNIADFELDIIEKEERVISMPVVVGRQYRSTPVFTGTMTYMELNPYWNIPPSIVKKDILPHVFKDPEYLSRQNIRVFRTWEADSPEIDPKSIEWSQFKAKHFPFKLRQEPGPLNALGRIKFMFPNKFDVYLHDTPAKDLFNRNKRSFSSGCIRVRDPIELASYLLDDSAEWNREKILSAIDSQVTQIVRIPHPVFVHILYWTAWVSEDGTVNFREDIYGRDRALDRAMIEMPPQG